MIDMVRLLNLQGQLFLLFLTGFLGTPVAEGIWGSQGTLLTAIFLIPQRIFMWSIGVSYFHKEKKNILLTLLKNPCIDAVLAAKYDRNPEFAVSCVAATTILSLIAIPLWGMVV